MKEVLKIKVAFADTDAMGIAYHGNYLKWFEMGRTELLRSSGLSYRKLVDRGIHLPVIEAFCRYMKPAFYDDVLSVYSKIENSRGVRLRVAYEIRIDRKLIASGYTEHAFTNEAGKVIRPPGEVLHYFNALKNA